MTRNVARRVGSVARGVPVVLYAVAVWNVSAQVTGTGDILPAQTDANAWIVGGQLVVGNDATGAVNAQNSSDIHSAGLVLGAQSTGDGTVTLSGLGTSYDVIGDVVLGAAGTGRLRIFDTARVVTAPAFNVRLGAQPGGRGELEINALAQLDVGRDLVVNGWADEQGVPAVALDGGARVRLGTGGAGGDFVLNQSGTHEVTFSAAGENTRLDAPGIWRIADGGPARAELFDGVVVVAGTVELGAGSRGRLLVDDAWVSTDALALATQSAGFATLDASATGHVQVGGGGVVSGAGQVDAAFAGTLFSTGRIELTGSAVGVGQRVELIGHDASWSTAAWIGIGGLADDDQARLHLGGATASAGTFAVIEVGGTLSGAGTVDLNDRLTVRGTVETTGGVLLVDAPNTSRFQNGRLVAPYAVRETDDDEDPLTPPIIEIGHGVLRFTADARLDGTLRLPRTDQRPDLDLPLYEPWTLIDTQDENGTLIGIFDTVEHVQVDAQTGLAVTYEAQRVEARRALLGDADLDGWINQADLDTVLANWGAASAHWVVGDFNGDGVVRQADLDAVLLYWGNHAAALWPQAIPEPTTAVWFSLFLAGSARLRVRGGGS